MSKTWLVIKREYLTRVRKKSFILTTLLVPLLMVALVGLSIGIQMWSADTKKIAVVDESEMIAPQLKSNSDIKYEILKSAISDSIKFAKDYDAVLHITPFDINKEASFNIYSNDQLGIGAQSDISKEINNIVIDKRIAASGVDVKVIDDLRANTIEIKNINKEGKESSNEIAVAIGYLSGFLLYMFMFFYGFNVMRSVMEEKTNRIAEIIVSSIKPFQLMIGKILGVALVGLTQFIIWVVLIGILYGILGAGLLGSGVLNNADIATQMTDTAITGGFNQSEMLHKVQTIVGGVNWFAILGWFLFYFLGGYFLYASLFAAVGSLVDEDAQESQQLTFPITLPIILGFLMMTATIKDPNGPIAVFGSIFPLTSPIVMMARIPYGITGEMLWQLPLSAILLIAGFLFTTWLAAKIYRTGILLYGKKITLKEVGKWLFKKGYV